jgi:hypothetical protein
MNTLEQLKPLIIEWANERNLIHSENKDKQWLKLIEECGELASAILKDNTEEQKDAIGDIFVVLIILEAQNGYNIGWNVRFQANNINLLLSRLLSEPTHYAGNIYQISRLLNLDITDCVNGAYNVIKNRTGQTVNGTFIKN